MKATGKGEKKILVVAEAPGEQEDEEGTQLIGKSGQELRKRLRKFGVDLDRDCWKTNAVICHPPDNETPTNAQIESCRPCLNVTVNELNPNVIILLGGIAVRSLVGYLCPEEEAGAISKWAGWRVPMQTLNTWICPTYHPAYLLRQNDPVLGVWFDRHLEAALKLRGRPWKMVPDYAAEVEIVHGATQAAKILRKMNARGGTVAFDYETNMLKPDAPAAAIYSCAVCWEGKKTIAYPWHGDAIEATSELLLNPSVKKIGANIKFEQRWTRRILGHGVRGWEWDCVLAAHILDNRPGITGVKFQALVRLGLPPYDNEIKPFLQASDSNRMNRIHEAELTDVLRYNGIDARCEYELAQKQMEAME